MEEKKDFCKIDYENMKIGEKLVGVLYLDSKIKYGLYKNKIMYLCKPSDNNYPYFLVPSKYENENDKKYVYIEYVEWDEKSKYPRANVLDYLGNVGSDEGEYNHLKYMCKLNDYKECKIEKAKIEKDIEKNKLLNAFEYHVFSIDPIGCKDIDDAFHYEYDIINNEHRIGVHISYVWEYFVEEKDKYFDIFSKRVSTFYGNKKNINMIPEEYSTNIGSFIERNHRHSLSIIYRIKNKEIIGYEIKKCVVYVSKNYDYESVNKFLLMEKEVLSKNQKIIYDINEITKKVFEDYDGKDSHKMVEYWMIQANCTMANECVKKYNKKVLLRTHQENKKIINEKKVLDKELSKFLEYYGGENAIYSIYNETMNNKHYQINKVLKDDTYYYTHYTSPIRRFCDMYIHGLYTNTLPEYVNEEYLEKMVIKMNDVSKRMRKYQNMSNIIEFILNTKESNYVKETYGYILELGEDMYRMYMPEYKFILKDGYRSKKYDVHLETIHDIENDKVIIKSNSNDENTDIYIEKTYELYKKYKIRLYVFPKKPMIYERILFEIIE